MMKTVINAANLNNTLTTNLNVLVENLNRTLSSVRRDTRNRVTSVTMFDLDEAVTNTWFAAAQSHVELRATDEKVWNTFLSIAESSNLHITKDFLAGRECFVVTESLDHVSVIAEVNIKTLAVVRDSKINANSYRKLYRVINSIPNSVDAELAGDILDYEGATIRDRILNALAENNIDVEVMKLDNELRKTLSDINFRLRRLGFAELDASEEVQETKPVEQPVQEAVVQETVVQETKPVEQPVQETVVQTEESEESAPANPHEDLLIILNGMMNLTAKTGYGRDRKQLLKRLRKAEDLSTPENVARMKTLADKLDISVAQLLALGTSIDNAAAGTVLTKTEETFEQEDARLAKELEEQLNEDSDLEEVGDLIDDVTAALDEVLSDAQTSLDVAADLLSDEDLSEVADEDEDDDGLSFDDEIEDEDEDDSDLDLADEIEELADSADAAYAAFVSKYDGVSDIALRRQLSQATKVAIFKFRSMSREDVLARLYEAL